MKAYPLRGISQIKYEDMPYPECPPGWCIVKVRAAGICSSDIPRIFSKGTYHFPTIPGHEFSGVVDKVADEVNNPLIGKKVSVFPLIPCQQCEQCRQQKYELCSHYDYIGSRRDGAFAEFVAVPVWNLVELSENTPYEEAALMEPLAVSLHAVKRLNINETDHIAIFGSGMIAFAAAQWAIKFGAKKVTVIGRSESKRSIAEAMSEINYAISENVNDEFDGVIEAVGSQQSINQSINITKPEGRIVLMGNPEGAISFSQETYWKILRKQLFVTGTWNSSYEKKRPCDWAEVRDALENHSLQAASLISHRFSQDLLMDALIMMHEHKVPYCKVMTIWNGD